MNTKIKQFILKNLLVYILFANMPITVLAETASKNIENEIFEGNEIAINNILEEDKVDVEVEGNTLVNLHKKQKYYFWCQDEDSNKYDQKILDNSIEITFKEQLIGWKYLELGKLNLNLIKPNTTYTIYFEEAQGLELISLCYGNFTGHIGSSDSFYVNKNKVIVTTSDFIGENVSSNIMLYGYTNATVGTTTKVSNVMIFEGNLEYEYLDYFEGMKSVTELENNTLNIISENKNLISKRMEYNNFNYNGLILNSCEDGVLNIHGTTTLNGDISYTSSTKDFIKIKPNIRYTIKPEVVGGTYESEVEYKFAFKLQDNLTGEIQWITITNEYSFSCKNPSTLSWIRIYLYEKSPRIFRDFKVRFQLTEVSTNDYSVYQSNRVMNILSEPLRSMPNGVKDKIIKKDGQWVVERRTALITYDGSDDEKWYLNGVYSKFAEIPLIEGPIHGINNDSFFYNGNITINNEKNTIGIRATHCSGNYYGIRIKPYYKDNMTLEEFKTYLKNNPITIVYQLPNVVYESLKVSSCVNLYNEVTYISTNSTIPANLKVEVDRTANRAQDAIETAKVSPAIENLAIARMWINLMKESTLKDQFQDEINNILQIEDLEIERKKVSANLDLYIKTKNTLSLSLDTNSVTFDNYSGVEDMEILNAVNLTVNSSLPYSLNAYMEEGFYNSDKTNSLEVNSLNIKENTETTYKQFSNIKEKVVLNDNCDEGNEKYHTIDLKLSGGYSYKTDIYKTIIKFEVEQK